MKHGKFTLVLFLAVSTFALSACISLASDITPPPDHGSQPVADLPAAPVAGGPELVEGAYPLQQPDVENGAVIYEEKCAPCHGDQGWGDGPQAAQLDVPVAAIGTSEFKDTSSPLEWYSMVTKGNIQKFMPPFSSLTDQERWDVVAYAFSLHDTKVLLPDGERVFAEKCAECHGADGNAATDDAALLADQETMASLTNMDVAGAVMMGIPGRMPNFADDVTDDELAGLVYYVRSLTLPVYGYDADAVVEEPAATEVADTTDAEATTPAEDGAEDTTEATEVADATVAAELEALTMTLTGTVTNLSGEAVPAGLEVNLLAYDHMDEVENITVVTDEEGMFSFEDVELVQERLYFALVDYDGVTYNSELVTGDATVSTYETVIEVYDTTNSIDNLSVDRLHVFFDFQKPDVVRVFMVYLVSNSGSEAVVPIDATNPVVRYTLPEGASNIFFQDESSANSALSLDNGFGDLRPVQPGESSYQMLFGYEMAYDDALTFVQPLDLPVDAVLVFVPDGSLKLDSDQVVSTGIEDISGSFYEVFEGDSIEIGGNLTLELKGTHPGGASVEGGGAPSAITLGDQNELIYGAVALILVVGVAGFWLMNRRRDEDDVDWKNDPESVMDAIIDLDEAYEDGEMDEAVYQARRTELKALLEELVAEDE